MVALTEKMQFVEDRVTGFLAVVADPFAPDYPMPWHLRHELYLGRVDRRQLITELILTFDLFFFDLGKEPEKHLRGDRWREECYREHSRINIVEEFIELCSFLGNEIAADDPYCSRYLFKLGHAIEDYEFKRVPGIWEELRPALATAVARLSRQAQEVAPEASEKGVKKPDNELVGEHIEAQIKAGATIQDFTRDGIAAALEIAQARVSRTDAWKELAKRKHAAPASREERALDAANNDDWKAYARLQEEEQRRQGRYRN